jgi:hypothetical protein
VVVDFVPPTEKNKLLIVALFIDTPRAARRERSRGRIQMRDASLKSSVEIFFLAWLDKASRYSENGCIQWDFGWLGPLAYIS